MSTRAQKAEVMQILKEEGKSNKEIADVLGVTPGTVSTYLSDPTGERERKSRLNTAVPCKRCGKPLSNKKGSKSGLCSTCYAVRVHDQRRWTPEAIIKAMKKFERENGRPPLSTEWLQRNGGKYPSTTAVQREFGSWDKGVRAAGFQSRKKEGKKVSELLDEIRSLSKYGVAPSTGKHASLRAALAKQGIEWEEACRLAGVQSRASLRRW